jgi:hypothetical protein
MFRGEALQQWVNQQMNQRVIEQLPRKLGITLFPAVAPPETAVKL